MATLRDIRRRITSVRSTEQITKAMKMVAAAKLRKAQERLVSARPYAYRLGQLLSHVAAKEDRSLHPLLAVREPSRLCYVIVTADRGLCGSFNTNITRRARSEIDSQDSVERVTLVTVGRKGFDHFSRRGYDILERYVNFFDQLEFKHAVNISSLIQRLYQSRELDRLFVVYNEFKSAAVQRVTVEQLLPIEPELPKFDKYEPVDYLYEPSAGKILDEICPKNLNIQIWRILLESYAAEQGARMVAMDAATDNAEEM
ncbi:MAG: ATP synthase F1 subunit gamma, partial [bacterium]